MAETYLITMGKLVFTGGSSRACKKRQTDDMTVATCRRSEHVARIVSTKPVNIDMSG
jgi:hypothetical protein